jgi:hypothetical protein
MSAAFPTAIDAVSDLRVSLICVSLIEDYEPTRVRVLSAPLIVGQRFLSITVAPQSFVQD